MFAGLCVATDGTFCCKNGSITDGVLRRASLVDGMKINLKFGPAHSNDRVLTVNANFDSMTGFCPQSSVEFEFRKRTTLQHGASSSSETFHVKSFEELMTEKRNQAKRHKTD
jgi:hypothetical protein